MVKLYSKKSCVMCDVTKRFLTMKKIEFLEIDIEQDKEALEKVTQLGYRSLPVVVSGDKHWSGHNVEMLKSL